MKKTDRNHLCVPNWCIMGVLFLHHYAFVLHFMNAVDIFQYAFRHG